MNGFRVVALAGALSVAVGRAEAQTPVLSLDGPTAFANYGWSLSAAGDVDQDGVPDLAVGGLQAFPSVQYAGGVFVHSGRTGAVLLSWSGPTQGSEFGQSIDATADVDQDGKNDVLVGAPSYTSSQAGKFMHGLVRVVSTGTSQSIWSFEGDSSGDGLGAAVSYVGDVDADGFVDLVAGAPDDDDFGSSSGSVRVWSGQTGLAVWTIHGQEAFGYDGSAVSAAGDFDQDGKDDVLVGAFGVGPGFSGRARVLSGANGAPLKTWVGAAGNDSLGHAVERVGDVDGDGTPDLVIAAPGATVAAASDGEVLVVSGVGGATILQLKGAAGGDSLGLSIAGLDADGDGFGDLLIGGKSRATLFSGSSGAADWSVTSAAATLFGFAVAGIGDVDGDGFGDGAVGAAAADPNGVTDAGTVTVWSGCTHQEAYGDGCPGTGGFVPSLSFDVCPAAGAATTFRIEGGLGGAPAVILIGAAPTSIPAGGACELLVAPLVTQIPLPLFGVGAGNGAIAIPVTIPANVAGGSATIQAFVGDGGVATGFSASAGLALDF